jgi:membrane associated rhomboid family serine protease
VIPVRDHLPTRTFPFVNYAIIAVNVVAYVFERATIARGVDPQELLIAYGLVPVRLFVDPVGEVISVFTSMFMHDPASLLHIVGNMLFLWIFGDNVEDAMGHFRYVVFYLVAGVAAAAAQIFADPTSTVPMVGASGAIAGVLAAYAVLYPRSPITVINPIWPMWFFYGIFLTLPAWLVIALFFLANLWRAIAGATGGVAFMAHVGGFVVGFVLVRLFMIGRVRMDDYARWERWARRRERSGMV